MSQSILSLSLQEQSIILDTIKHRYRIFNDVIHEYSPRSNVWMALLWQDNYRVNYTFRHRKRSRQFKLLRFAWIIRNQKFPPKGHFVYAADGDRGNLSLWNLKLAKNIANLRDVPTQVQVRETGLSRPQRHARNKRANAKKRLRRVYHDAKLGTYVYWKDRKTMLQHSDPMELLRMAKQS